MIRKKFLVQGAVQGVGFRPFIYNLARQHQLTGSIANTTHGVTIEAQGPPHTLEKFIAALTSDHPPLAQPTISEITTLPLELNEPTFVIRSSQNETETRPTITPDATTCLDCLTELNDPSDHRYRYPFINCTNCGPRYTIIFDLPYDRPNTTMRPFTMCPPCRREYEDPTNRRFHAQPNACPACGPKIWLTEKKGQPIECEDPVKKTVDLLEAGKIVAVKGLGGFHLAVRADRDPAVQLLRQRKYRKDMAFAVMVRDMTAAHQLAQIDSVAEKLLTGIARPIVLCPKKSDSPLCPAVAPHSRFWGIMLPYTPLHYLLMQGSYPALVMTSGNTSDEPIESENDSALNRLSGIADYFLLHNRDIYTRCDDSVVKVFQSQPFMIRRARGYVPQPITVSRHWHQDILAVGAELKNSITYLKSDQACTSQHIGTLTDAATYAGFQQTIKKLGLLLQAQPKVIACDLHPSLLSTRFAEQFPEAELIPVQHHHAHIAAVMGEYNLEGPIIGLSADGLGYGSDGSIWGGELLTVWRDRFQRRGFLEPIPQPGGDAAARQPWRMALSYLIHSFDPEKALHVARQLLSPIEPAEIDAVAEMIAKQINSPLTSSTGRLFDAVSALLGICYHNTYDARAAIELENLAQSHDSIPYPFQINQADQYLILSVKPLVQAIVNDIQNSVSPAQIAHRFHHALATSFTALIQSLSSSLNLNRVALAGGVFQNEILLLQLVQLLEKSGLQVFFNRQLPVNDGAVSLGQAIVADATMSHKNNT